MPHAVAAACVGPSGARTISRYSTSWVRTVGDEKIELKVPKALLSAPGMSSAEIAADFSRRVALSLHADGVLSTGKAAELAGMPYVDFLDLLRSKKVEAGYSLEELEADLATLRELDGAGRGGRF